MRSILFVLLLAIILEALTHPIPHTHPNHHPMLILDRKRNRVLNSDP